MIPIAIAGIVLLLSTAASLYITATVDQFKPESPMEVALLGATASAELVCAIYCITSGLGLL